MHANTTSSNSPRTHRGEAQPLHVAQLAGALLKIQTVRAVTGMSDSTIFRKTAAGQFPEPIRMGARCTRWRSEDVQAWIAAQQPAGTKEPS